jgi:hypothetical protein
MTTETEEATERTRMDQFEAQLRELRETLAVIAQDGARRLERLESWQKRTEMRGRLWGK